MRRATLCRINATHRRGLASQHGSILPYLSVAVGIVALIALTLMTGLGDVILHRRDASNATDAAALTAAEAWGHSIESTYATPLSLAVKTSFGEASEKDSAHLLDRQLNGPLNTMRSSTVPQ
ncbi:pilus assembly protein TadG-related protein [Actinomyces sp. HMSC075C01]|uniref:pilus assembly protein TadG-related protein n=1 Tax=Actinomyces sp. HMSC075C01 TaxID=1739387 RepID=UPI00114CC479